MGLESRRKVSVSVLWQNSVYKHLLTYLLSRGSNFKGKGQVKQPYFTLTTRDSNSTDRLEDLTVCSYALPFSLSAPV